MMVSGMAVWTRLVDAQQVKRDLPPAARRSV